MYGLDGIARIRPRQACTTARSLAVACITGKCPLSFAMPESSRTADRPASTASLRVEAVRLRRGITTVFDGLDLRLDEPRVGLIGDNGAGKTSLDRKSTRLNSSHLVISYAVFCLKKKKQ